MGMHGATRLTGHAEGHGASARQAGASCDDDAVRLRREGEAEGIFRSARFRQASAFVRARGRGADQREPSAEPRAPSSSAVLQPPSPVLHAQHTTPQQNSKPKERGDSDQRPVRSPAGPGDAVHRRLHTPIHSRGRVASQGSTRLRSDPTVRGRARRLALGRAACDGRCSAVAGPGRRASLRGVAKSRERVKS